MQNVTNAVLDRIKERRRLPSDYAIAKAFHAGHSRISSYRSGNSSMDSSIAVDAAKLADMDPALLIAELGAERAKSPEEKAAWLRLANLARAQGQPDPISR